MKQRGRKSAESLTVVPFVDVARQKPIEPPAHLTAEQKQIWQDTVGGMKPGQFPAAVHPLLEVYCTCISRTRFIERQLREVDPKTDFKRYRALTSMQCRESALLCSLSTRLRLLKPSSSRQDRHESSLSKPWELHKSKPWEDDSPA
jgi:phage terminase small subunit